MTADPAAAAPAADSDELTQALIAFIQDEVAIATGDIAADTDLLLGGFVDSLGVVVIVGWLESRLDIRIDPADVVLENFLTVGDMVRYVRNR
ncbi:MAG: acyl carrier protein [Ilumatobacter sp.]